MVRFPMPPTLPLRVLILSALSASLVSAVPTNFLFARQSTCAKDAFKCDNSSFCCSTGNTCISLAGNTTVLCCPEGSSCNRIETITCNVDELDPEKNADAPVKTTVFDVALEKCGNKCCPFGYSCSENKECVKNQDQSQAPKGHSTSTSASTSTKTSTATRSTGVPTTQPSTTGISATTTGAPTSTATNDAATGGGQHETNGPDVGSIVGGVVGGCAVLLIAAVVIFICVRRRAQNKSTGSEKPRSDRSGFSTIISDPIVQPNSYRTEFILRPPSTNPATPKRQSIPCISEKRITRRSIRNPFSSPSLSYVGTVSRASSVSSQETPRRGVVGARLAPIRTMKGSSQYLKPQRTSVLRQPSAESIDVFADPKTVDDHFNRQTTFTELMDEADLRGVGRNKPYVPGTTPRI